MDWTIPFLSIQIASFHHSASFQTVRNPATVSPTPHTDFLSESNPTDPPIDSPNNAPADTSTGGVSNDNPMVTPSRSVRPAGIGRARELAAAAARVALDNKGDDVMVIDVTEQSAEFDMFVLATGQSRRQLHAISEQIDDELEKHLGDRRMGIEGYDESRWIVLDYGNIVVHLFDDETRQYYDLESLWADGTVVPLSDLGIQS